MIRRNVTVEGISPCVFAIASILFSNYYENRIDAMANTQHNNVILFQVFLRIIEKLISRWGGGGGGGGPNNSVSEGGVGGTVARYQRVNTS